MCTSGIYHTENIYYSAFMDMRNIFSLRHGRDEPNEAYYRRFEAHTSTAKLAKYTATTHV